MTPIIIFRNPDVTVNLFFDVDVMAWKIYTAGNSYLGETDDVQGAIDLAREVLA